MRNRLLYSTTFLLMSICGFSQSFSSFEFEFSHETKQNIAGEDYKYDFKLIPAKNYLEAKKLWSADDGSRFLDGAVMNGSAESGSVFVDLVSDFLGPLRVSLATTVSSVDSTTSENISVEKFISGGGLGVINSIFVGPTLTWNQGDSYITTILNPRLSCDAPALGSSAELINFNGDLGIELKLNIPLQENKLGLIGSYRVGSVVGSNNFYEAIDHAEKSIFTYSQVSVGISIPNSNIAILYNKVLHGPDSLFDISTLGRVSVSFFGR